MTQPSPSGPARLPLATDGTRRAGLWLARAGERALDLLLPPSCVACGEPVVRQGEFCSACFSAMTFISEPRCDGCGLPFASRDALGTAHRCQQCLDHPFAFQSGRAALLYDAGARRVILPFKHGDQPGIARVLAPHMARAGADLLHHATPPVLVPVPLHRMRLFQRRYNQAALLAQAIGRRTGCPVCPDALRRRLATASLDHRTAEERKAIVAAAFDVRPSRQPVIEGRDVVLIDDVMTSGATADACAATLLRAGATRVDVLVAARVPLSDRNQTLDEDADPPLTETGSREQSPFGRVAGFRAGRTGEAA